MLLCSDTPNSSITQIHHLVDRERVELEFGNWPLHADGEGCACCRKCVLCVVQVRWLWPDMSENAYAAVLLFPHKGKKTNGSNGVIQDTIRHN